MGKISNKVCLVTGGGSGIGRALCEELAASGARVVYVVDIDAKSAKDVAEQHLHSLATHPNFRSGYDVADVGKEKDIQRVILSAWQTFGSVDAYFSNAGILTIGGIDESEVSDDAWHDIWKINVMSHVYAARHIFPLWKKKKKREKKNDHPPGGGGSGGGGGGGGIFVITGSAAGLLMQVGSLPYHMTKHAAVSVADWLAVHHHHHAGADDDGGGGVSVHCLCPQAVNTNMISSHVTALSNEDENKANRLHAANGGPAGVDGIKEPREVAAVALEGIESGTFMILPHPEVGKYFMRKATDYDRWIRGMRRVKGQFDSLLGEEEEEAVPSSKL